MLWSRFTCLSGLFLENHFLDELAWNLFTDPDYLCQRAEDRLMLPHKRISLIPDMARQDRAYSVLDRSVDIWMEKDRV